MKPKHKHLHVSLLSLASGLLTTPALAIVTDVDEVEIHANGFDFGGGLAEDGEVSSPATSKPGSA